MLNNPGVDGSRDGAMDAINFWFLQLPTDWPLQGTRCRESQNLADRVTIQSLGDAVRGQ